MICNGNIDLVWEVTSLYLSFCLPVCLFVCLSVPLKYLRFWIFFWKKLINTFWLLLTRWKLMHPDFVNFRFNHRKWNIKNLIWIGYKLQQIKWSANRYSEILHNSYFICVQIRPRIEVTYCLKYNLCQTAKFILVLCKEASNGHVPVKIL